VDVDQLKFRMDYFHRALLVDVERKDVVLRLAQMELLA
jgi:hypothetical protein